MKNDTHRNASVIQAYPSPLLEALEFNLAEHVAYVPRKLDKHLVEEGNGLTRVDARLASETFNKILFARLETTEGGKPGKGIDASIDEALAYFDGVDRPFTWWVGPCSRPLDLEARLAERGLQPIENEVGMTLELKDLSRDIDLPEGFHVRRVTQLDELEQFAALLSNLSAPADDAVVAYFERASPFLLKENCPMHFFVAYKGDEPAAAVELMLSPYNKHPHGLAGIHMSATAEPYRRRGLGFAITWTALDHARKLGAEVAGTLAAPEAKGLFSNLGFQASCRFVEYAR